MKVLSEIEVKSFKFFRKNNKKRFLNSLDCMILKIENGKYLNALR